MKEIKFRYWYNNQMYKVNSIDFNNKLINLNSADIIGLEEGILMQYTGIKDKNGIEIYENDILREYSNEIEDWVISYEYGKFIGTCNGICEDLYELSDLEVIGNIYDK